SEGTERRFTRWVPRRRPETIRGRRSRYDRRFYAVGLAVLVVAIAGKALGADSFAEYPATEISSGAGTLAVSAAFALSGLAPLRRRPSRPHSVLPGRRSASKSLPAGGGI
ncbi:MAG: hypothetical protein ACLGG5_00800, partial [Thermoleophilia bacterium]